MQRRAAERDALLAAAQEAGAQRRSAAHDQLHAAPFSAARAELFERLQAANPEPVSELQYSTPFELLVAVMLSAHTTDKSVNAATAKLFPVANTPPPCWPWGWLA